MINRSTLIKSAIAGALALGTVAGTASMAQANGFTFSWATPQGTFVINPQNPNGHFVPHGVQRHQPHRPQTQGVGQQHQPSAAQQQLRPRQARRTLRQAGFRDIQFLRERRNVYVFEARGQRGYRRIAVNKFSGEILWRWGRG